MKFPVSIRLTLLISLLIFTTGSFAQNSQWTQIPSSAFSLAPPPSKDSEEYKQDFIELLELQESRTAEACELSSHQRSPAFRELYAQSGFLTNAEIAKLQPFMSKIGGLAERVSQYYKGKYKRARPYNEDHRIQPCVSRPTGSKSYPSSHAAVSEATACILAVMIPAKANEIREYGQYLGDLRVIVGVHHPSDVRAGQDIGDQVCERLQNEPEFQAELKRNL